MLPHNGASAVDNSQSLKTVAVMSSQVNTKYAISSNSEKLVLLIKNIKKYCDH